MSRNRQQTNYTRLVAAEAAPILVPACTADRTYGDHLRHLAEHAGAIPATLDEFGRCVVCVRLGCFRLNA